MNSLTDLAANPLVHRLGWALVHSLWQMAAVAAALAVAMAIVPRRRANVRYACACAALLVSMALFTGTFAMVAPPPSPDPIAINQSPVPALGAGPDSVASSEVPRALRANTPTPGEASKNARPVNVTRPNFLPQSPSLLQEIASTLQPALPWLVLLWTLGVLLVGLWHTGGIALTWRLRRLGGESATEHVLAIVRDTAQRLGIRRAVRVLACARSAGPAVIGVLRPVILLPAALLSGLTPAQLQALIAHELAHVRRWDYLTNLVQVAIESMLFYHPATWWIGRVIRRERESCCDDLAISAGPNRYDYARALAAAADHGRATARPRFAMAAQGGSLMQRIQRLLAPSTTRRGDLLRRSALAGLFAVALAAAIVGCSLSGPKADAGTSTPSAVKPPQMRIAAVADANGQYIVEFRLPDGSPQPRLRVQAGKLARMTIGRDAAETQSMDVTVTPDGKQVRVTYHVILAVKGGFHQWTQRNAPWPLGEWKDMSEDLHFDAADPKAADVPAKGELVDPARAKRAPVVLRVRKFSRKLDGIEPTMESYEGGKKLPLKFEQLNLLQVLKNEGPEKGLKPGGYLVVKYDERDTGLPDGEFTAYLVAHHPDSYKPGLHDYCFIGEKAFDDQKVPGNCKEGISNVAKSAAGSAPVTTPALASSTSGDVKAADATVSPKWGQPSSGVRVRLRVEGQAIQGQPLALRIEAVNEDTRRLLVMEPFPFALGLIVDGVWYRYSGQADKLTQAPFDPGKSVARKIAIRAEDWRQSAKVARPAPVRFDEGRHIVQVAFYAEPAKGEDGNPVKALSNTVELDIASPTAGGTHPAADVKAAEADIAAAEKKLIRTRELVHQGIAPASDLDQAEADVQRAKLRLELAKADTDAARRAVNVKLAEVDLAAAERRLERARQLFQKGLATKAEVDEAQAALEQAKAALERAKAGTGAKVPATQPGAAPPAVYARIILPTDKPVAGPPVENWISKELAGKGKANVRAVCPWVCLDEKGAKKYDTDIWDGVLDGNQRCGCPVGGSIERTPDGNATAEVSGFSPGGEWVRKSLPAKPGSRAIGEVGKGEAEAFVAFHVGPPGAVTRSELIAFAQAEAKKAWRRKHKLAADAPVADIGDSRYDVPVYPDGENWRVIFYLRLEGINGHKVEDRVEAVLDQAGTIVGDVKFVSLVDDKPATNEGAKGPEGSAGAAKAKAVPPATAPGAMAPGAPAPGAAAPPAPEPMMDKAKAAKSDTVVRGVLVPAKTPDQSGWPTYSLTVAACYKAPADRPVKVGQTITIKTIKEIKGSATFYLVWDNGQQLYRLADPYGTGGFSHVGDAPAVYAKVIYLLRNPPRDKDRPEPWIAKELAARGHKNFMAVSGWVRLNAIDANKPTPIWDGNSDWIDDGHKVWGCSVGKARIIDRAADGNMTVEISSFMSASALIRVKVADGSGSRAITVVDDLPGHDPCTCVALHVGPPPETPATRPAATDKEIAELVQQLAHADPKVREAATRKLLEIGEPARAALEKAAATATAPADFAWGEAVNGLQTRLTVEKNRVPLGEPVQMKLEMRNIGKAAKQYDSQQVAVNDPLIVHGPRDQKVPFVAGSVSTLGGTRAIQPGQTVVLFDGLDAADQYLLVAPGTHTFQFRGRKTVPFLGEGETSIPPSNTARVELTGEPTASMKLAARLRVLTPTGWQFWFRSPPNDNVTPAGRQEGRGTEYTWQTGGKLNGRSVQLWVMGRPAAGAQGVVAQSEDLGDTPVGRAYLLASPNVASLWPNFRADILAALRRTETPATHPAKPHAAGGDANEGKRPPAATAPAAPSTRESLAKVVGMAVDEKGKPVAGAEVRAFPYNNPPERVTTRTKDDGSFEIDVKPYTNLSVTVEAADPRYHGMVWPLPVVKAGQKTDVGKIVLKKDLPQVDPPRQ